FPTQKGSQVGRAGHDECMCWLRKPPRSKAPSQPLAAVINVVNALSANISMYYECVYRILPIDWGPFGVDECLESRIDLGNIRAQCT
ncbi:MAG: hypothetical protein Q4D27_04405, partial [Coriobacteriia bacterium]|nr:hypothetical protein [Coriobacteriia bacterium]